jgi:hypothetical protein
LPTPPGSGIVGTHLGDELVTRHGHEGCAERRGCLRRIGLALYTHVYFAVKTPDESQYGA